MNNNIQIENWLNEVTNECHEFALETDLDFYVFQTPIIYNPELLIIGINPGGMGSYSQYLKKNNVKKRSPNSIYYSENTLINKPEWEIENKLKGNDVMRNAFKRLFNKENNLDILQNTVFMNMFYFNTQKEIHINNIKTKDVIKKYCIEKTIEFIDIIRPKNILFLTSNNKNLKDVTIKNIEEVGNNIKKGLLKDKVVYAIPHYGSYSAYSYENSEKTGKSLSKIFLK